MFPVDWKFVVKKLQSWGYSCPPVKTAWS